MVAPVGQMIEDVTGTGRARLLVDVDTRLLRTTTTTNAVVVRPGVIVPAAMTTAAALHRGTSTRAVTGMGVRHLVAAARLMNMALLAHATPKTRTMLAVHHPVATMIPT